ncbi:hypothetical protein BR93DRAFT_274324 [Coniochaeta sp. PMI_546]|nr:hypothetical protein BR93DRAFT_274324 [Coniochaeta sp. PMI_546]
MIDTIAIIRGPQDDIPIGVYATILKSLQARVEPIPTDTKATRSGTIWMVVDPTAWSGDIWAGLLEENRGNVWYPHSSTTSWKR